MLHYQTMYALAFVNAVLGSFIMFVCFCRVVVSSKKVLGRVRLKFILLGPTALAFGFSPFWGNLPGWSETAFLLAVAIGLLSETYQWRGGPPNSVQTDTMPGDLYSSFKHSWPQLFKDWFIKLKTKVKTLYEAASGK